MPFVVNTNYKFSFINIHFVKTLKIAYSMTF